MNVKMEKVDANMEQQFDLNLIEAVKMNPVIYDRSHYNYKHFVKKAQTWKIIAELVGAPEQKCTKRWKSLRDKFAREMKLSQGSRWRYFKQMQFLVESIRQYRESLLGKCGNLTSNSNQVNQVEPAHQQQQSTQVVDNFIIAQPFNGATVTAQTLTHAHEYVITGDGQLAAAGKEQKQPYFYESSSVKRERSGEEEHADNMLSSIKIFQNTVAQNVSAEDHSFGVVVTDMLNTLGVRQKAEAKVHIIKYLTDMQLLAQHNKY